MIRTREARHISVAIDCTLQQAYDFLLVPGNFPKWASGLAGSLAQIDGEWVAATIHGPLKVRFSDRNEFGVLDHSVFPPDGEEIYVPLRVVANDSGRAGSAAGPAYREEPAGAQSGKRALKTGDPGACHQGGRNVDGRIEPPEPR